MFHEQYLLSWYPSFPTNADLGWIARGQTNRLTSGVTSPLSGAKVQNPLFCPLKRGCDPDSHTICLPPWLFGQGSVNTVDDAGTHRQSVPHATQQSINGMSWHRAIFNYCRENKWTDLGLFNRRWFAGPLQLLQTSQIRQLRRL